MRSFVPLDAMIKKLMTDDLANKLQATDMVTPTLPAMVADMKAPEGVAQRPSLHRSQALRKNIVWIISEENGYDNVSK